MKCTFHQSHKLETYFNFFSSLFSTLSLTIFFLLSFVPMLKAADSHCTSLCEVSVLGASTSGALVEGRMGAWEKGQQQRFHCHSIGPQQGFVGSQITIKPVSMKYQPGIFPAPVMGPASLTFDFYCPDTKHTWKPLIVKPDGTIFEGQLMSNYLIPQTIIIPSPAQTGIYTLFVLSQSKKNHTAPIEVKVSTSTQPKKSKTFQLKPFNPQFPDTSLISAEFIYRPHF